MATPKTYSFERSSVIPGATQEAVWARIGSWDGVNHELGPELKMTFPARFARLDDIPADNTSHFASTILLFGILPIDRHHFSLVARSAPHFFDERSSNLNMSVWTHKRTLVAHNGGVTVTDVCTFVPRLFFMGPLLKAIFSGVFNRRHKRLVRSFQS